jgi:hypothetical protein
MAKQVMMPKALESKIPPLYSQEKLGEAAIVHVKYFTPWSNWTWYGTEYDPEDRTFFGLVKGFETELGYFSLTELEEIRGPFGLRIERDQYFTPKTVAECRKDGV